MAVITHGMIIMMMMGMMNMMRMMKMTNKNPGLVYQMMIILMMNTIINDGWCFSWLGFSLEFWTGIKNKKETEWMKRIIKGARIGYYLTAVPICRICAPKQHHHRHHHYHHYCHHLTHIYFLFNIKNKIWIRQKKT